MTKPPGLSEAYALSSADDVTALYKEWAASYDVGFSMSQGYQLPQIVTRAFVAAGGQGPVLDVGAGTGLVAEQLRTVGVGPIDGLDLSEDMLAVANAKALYRGLIVADVTQPLRNVMPPYHGVVSAGTFTHGHVGIEGIPPLLDVVESGAIFALSVNATHFAAKSFAAGFDGLGDQITDLSVREMRIYDDRASANHRDDLACIVTFKKT